MQYVIDIILVAVFALVVFLAAKKGFFLTLMELAAYIVALIGAKLLSSALAPAIYKGMVYGSVRAALEHNLGGIGEQDVVSQAGAAVNSIPPSLDGVLCMIGVDRAALAESIANSKYAGKNVVENVMDNAITPVLTAIIQTLLFILMAVLFVIVLRLIIRSLNKIIKKMPVLKQINSSLGAVLGVLKGIFVVVILALIIGALSGVFGSPKYVEMVNSSFIIKGTSSLLDSISGYTNLT